MKSIVLPLGAVCLLCRLATASARPNIVFVLFDDLPYAGMSALGNTRIETPNMDRLAKEGMFFSRAYSEVVCSPSRFTIFTGHYAARHGHTTVGGNQYPRALMREPELVRDPIAPGGFNLARLLKNAGYTTAIFGKWHMPGVPIRPRDAEAFGFDEAVPVNHRAPYKDVVKNFDLATDFVRRQDDGRPFFLYVPTFVTHGPQEVTKEEVDAMSEKTGTDRKLAEMLVTISRTDACLGRLLGALEEKDFTDNTLFLMASDNGAYSLERYSEINKPFREGKGSRHEGGIRVPRLVRWPDVTQPGTVSRTPVIIYDWFPTLLQAAGCGLTASTDGVDLAPLLRGETSGAFDRSLVWHFPNFWDPLNAAPIAGPDMGPSSTLRRGDWKLIYFHTDQRFELFNLAEDLGEQHDLAARQPQLVCELARELSAYLHRNHAPLPIAKMTGRPVPLPVEALERRDN